MKIVFVSNYYNHHQHALSQAFEQMFPGEYHFIATSEMRQDRRELGYGQWEIPAYVRTSYTGKHDLQACLELIWDADVVIAGSAPDRFFRRRLAAGKLVFRYCERPLKDPVLSLHQQLHFMKTRIACRAGKQLYLLCAGGYTAGDYLKHGCFTGHTYRWGYFPETKYYDQELLHHTSAVILWAGRFLPWKHPELALSVASRLKDAGYSFRMDLIGSGELQQELEQCVRRNGLQSHVRLLGPMKPELVRNAMEKADIYLLTSNRQEGWGAVLNEAMNSGCAVIASHTVGSAPFLVKNGVNGLIFRSEDADSLCTQVKYLLDSPAERKRLGKAAYDTITQMWNADVAAARLVELAEHILAGEASPDLYSDGPCSRANVTEENWYLDETY